MLELAIVDITVAAAFHDGGIFLDQPLLDHEPERLDAAIKSFGIFLELHREFGHDPGRITFHRPLFDLRTPRPFWHRLWAMAATGAVIASAIATLRAFKAARIIWKAPIGDLP